MRRSPVTNTTDPPAASTSVASSVSTPSLVCAARNSLAAKRLRRLHRDQRVARHGLEHSVTFDAFDRVDDRQRRNCCIGAARDGVDDEREQPARRQAARGVVHDDHVGRLGDTCEPGPDRVRTGCAAGCRTDVDRCVPLGAGGQDDDNSGTRFTRGDAGRAIEHAATAQGCELLGAAEARAATRRDDDRPRFHPAESGLPATGRRGSGVLEASEQQATGRGWHH